jgi:hypothetical protein
VGLCDPNRKHTFPQGESYLNLHVLLWFFWNHFFCFKPEQTTFSSSKDIWRRKWHDLSNFFFSTMYYYMEKVENGAKAKDLGERGYLYQCYVVIGFL